MSRMDINTAIWLCRYTQIANIYSCHAVVIEFNLSGKLAKCYAEHFQS